VIMKWKFHVLTVWQMASGAPADARRAAHYLARGTVSGAAVAAGLAPDGRLSRVPADVTGGQPVMRVSRTPAELMRAVVNSGRRSISHPYRRPRPLRW
jgi:hypothetical protein